MTIILHDKHFMVRLPFHSERDNFEADLKELTRRFETLDLTHAALTRERNTLGKEVLHTHTLILIEVSLGVHCYNISFFSCPPGGNIAAVGDSLAEG